MALGTMNTVKRGLTHLCAAHEPCVWGKWPTHGDFVRHNATHAQAEFWLKWTDEYWYRRPQTPDIPVAFVFPPGTTEFPSRNFVHGVIAPSQDKVGRLCPLIVFQEVTPREMARMWPLEVDRSIDGGGRHMLYWWSRFVAAANGSTDLSKLISDIEMVWHIYAPTFLEMLGGSLGLIDIGTLEKALANWQSASQSDDAKKLKGVRRLPWSDWPSRLLRKSGAIPAYWMQDVHGGYVCASDGVLKMWGVRA